MPVAVFPLSSKLPDVIEFGTNDFELSVKRQVGYHFGPTRGEFNGSSHFKPNLNSQIVFNIKNTSSFLSAKSITVSCWFYFDKRPDTTVELFGFQSSSSEFITLKMEVDKEQLTAFFGTATESPTSNSVRRSTNMKFVTGVWYHIAMGYNDGTTFSHLMVNGYDEAAKDTKKIYLRLTDKFSIGNLFPGRIACVHIFQDQLYPRYVQDVMYSCYNNEPGKGYQTDL